MRWDKICGDGQGGEDIKIARKDRYECGANERYKLGGSTIKHTYHLRASGVQIFIQKVQQGYVPSSPWNKRSILDSGPYAIYKEFISE